MPTPQSEPIPPMPKRYGLGWMLAVGCITVLQAANRTNWSEIDLFEAIIYVLGSSLGGIAIGYALAFGTWRSGIYKTFGKPK
jgi:hypothetical protein